MFKSTFEDKNEMSASLKGKGKKAKDEEDDDEDEDGSEDDGSFNGSDDDEDDDDDDDSVCNIWWLREKLTFYESYAMSMSTLWPSS